MSAQATHRAFALVAVAALAACDDGKAPRSADAPIPEVEVTAGANPATAPALAQDIEAPEVFQIADEGLWDGRPSLGGIWVAHSDVTDPERVIIRNEDNGRSITAALFRRERENPGPRFQVSSDAADALGMLAGAPATLSVTALRREDPPPVEAEEDGTSLAEGEAAPVDDAAGATLAEADTAADDAALAGTPEAAAAEAARVAEAEAIVAAEAAPKKKGLFGFLRRKQPAVEGAAPVLDVATLEDAPAADAPADGADIAAATTAALGGIEVATLSEDGATATPVASDAAPAAAAELPVMVEEPRRKRRGLFGLGRRDEEPLSALSEEHAAADTDAPVEVAALPEAVGDPIDPIAVAGAPDVPVIAEEPAPKKRRGLFGFGRRQEEPLTAMDPVEVAATLPAEAEVVAEPLAQPEIEPLAEAEVLAETVEPAPKRRGLFGFGKRRDEAAAEVETVAPADVEVAALGDVEETAPALDPDADFVQAGRFRSMAEAETAAEGLRSGGVLPSLRRGGDGDWLVLVGPFPDPADRTAILDKVKSLGFDDAYLVPG